MRKFMLAVVSIALAVRPLVAQAYSGGHQGGGGFHGAGGGGFRGGAGVRSGGFRSGGAVRGGGFREGGLRAGTGPWRQSSHGGFGRGFGAFGYGFDAPWYDDFDGYGYDGAGYPLAGYDDYAPAVTQCGQWVWDQGAARYAWVPGPCAMPPA